MAQIINLTPHSVFIMDKQGNTIKEFPSAGTARAISILTQVGLMDDVPLARQDYGEPEGLPDPEEGFLYIVNSVIVAAARRAGRTLKDLLVTAEPVRDRQGGIVGYRYLAYA